jgi:tripartite-type tricarboxylate transporter receptor subunit TctC
MNPMSHFHVLRSAFTVVACVATATAAAQLQRPGNYPRKSVRLLVGIPPGGGIDTVARAVAQSLSERWGQSVLVDNRTGAGGAIAMEVAAQAASDGYTLLAGSVGTVATATPLKKVEFDTRKVYAPVIRMYSQPYVLAAEPSLPVTSVRELIAYAKSRPGTLNYASTGVGSASHLGMEFFKFNAGVDLVHVPYRGLGAAMIDVMSGQIQLLFGAAIIVTPNVRSGKLKALAVGSLQRSPAYPTLPTVSESGLPGFEWGNSYAIFAPAATPVATVFAINKAVGEVVGLPEVQKKFAADGVEPVAPNTFVEFRNYFAREIAKFEKFFRESGIKL